MTREEALGNLSDLISDAIARIESDIENGEAFDLALHEEAISALQDLRKEVDAAPADDTEVQVDLRFGRAEVIARLAKVLGFGNHRAIKLLEEVL